MLCRNRCPQSKLSRDFVTCTRKYLLLQLVILPLADQCARDKKSTVLDKNVRTRLPRIRFTRFLRGIQPARITRRGARLRILRNIESRSV